MKCANPNCNRGIGLVCHQRHSFDKRRFCSKKCRDEFVDEKPKQLQQELLSTSYFEWLLSRPTAKSEQASKFTRVPASAVRLNCLSLTYSTVLCCRISKRVCHCEQGANRLQACCSSTRAEMKSESWLYIG